MKNNSYDPKKIEKKWQKEWEKKKAFAARNDSKKKKYYSLMEFPYPSGEGLHTGHVRGYTAMDVISRKRRMEGYNVLFPIGFDAFGLPTENYAIKTGMAPDVVTKKNIKRYTEQFKSLGFSFDWSRVVDTTDPKYYRWTQWIFLQLLKHGLAYKDKISINWCPRDKIGLANEEVIAGKCERCGTAVEKREKEQWMLSITKYADKLDRDLDKTDFLEKIKLQQRNWIGRSEGAEIEFKVASSKQQVAREIQNANIKVFTTRPDTLFGVTYLVLAPENPIIGNWKLEIGNWNEVEQYINKTKKKAELERTSEDKDKTGVKLDGVTAINPANGEEIPVWIADYVLAHYGTGAVMAVPAHDERDFAFAKKYGLGIKETVIEQFGEKLQNITKRDVAKAVIIKEDKILLVKEHSKTFEENFSLPGGAYESGETDTETITREVIEETGYKNFVIKKYLGRVLRFYTSRSGGNWARCIAGYEVELLDELKERVSDTDVLESKWFEINEGIKILEGGDFNAEAIFVKRFVEKKYDCFVDEGVLINSGKFDGMSSEVAKKEITKFVGGKWVTKFKLRDWVFSRQRYWGEPIPVVHCEKCGIVPLAEKDLPLKLPKVAKYQPTDTGESPLAAMTKWVNVKCPNCAGKAKRETDTMPNWAGSSWYYLAYTSRGISNFQFPISNKKSKTNSTARKNMEYWMPVDWYNGGMEHTTLHLLYSRFWNKFLYDIGVVPTSEPYKKRTSHGMILAGDGEKMSKSRGNVINPDDIVKTYGADTLRVYEMFMGPFDQAISWGEENIIGVRRFLEKVWKLSSPALGNLSNNKKKSREKPRAGLDTGGEEYKKFETLLHKTIQKVSDDIESIGFNTAISSMMILVNEMEKAVASGKQLPVKDFEMFIKILSPFAPHICQEIWHSLGHKTLISAEEWPKADKKKMIESSLTIVVQINGRVRAELYMPADSAEEDVLEAVKKLESVDKWISGKEIKKVIYVKNRLVNLVI